MKKAEIKAVKMTVRDLSRFYELMENERKQNGVFGHLKKIIVLAKHPSWEKRINILLRTTNRTNRVQEEESWDQCGQDDGPRFVPFLRIDGERAQNKWSICPFLIIYFTSKTPMLRKTIIHFTGHYKPDNSRTTGWKLRSRRWRWRSANCPVCTNWQRTSKKQVEYLAILTKYQWKVCCATCYCWPICWQ